MSVLVKGAIFDATPGEGLTFVVNLTELEQDAQGSERRFHESQC